MHSNHLAKAARIALFPVFLLFSGPLAADSFKTISRVIDVTTVESLEIETGVAEMEVEFYEGEAIELEIELEGKRRWFALRRASVDEVILQVRSEAENLYLGIRDQKVEQHWRLKIPSKLALRVDVGVGDIEFAHFANSLDLQVGVGSVLIDVADVDFRMIHASAGVGDSSIRGFDREGVGNDRSFVSSDSYYHGEGELEIAIAVGVGDAVVRRR